MKKTALTAALVGLVIVAGALAARADVNDSRITIKAKIALLTTDGLGVGGADVETIDGNVTSTEKWGPPRTGPRPRRRSAGWRA